MESKSVEMRIVGQQQIYKWNTELSNNDDTVVCWYCTILLTSLGKYKMVAHDTNFHPKISIRIWSPNMNSNSPTQIFNIIYSSCPAPNQFQNMHLLTFLHEILTLIEYLSFKISWMDCLWWTNFHSEYQPIWKLWTIFFFLNLNFQLQKKNILFVNH